MYSHRTKMKKKDRVPIIKGKMKLLKTYLRKMLSDNFKEKSFDLNLNGNVLEATFDQVTINEVLEKITPEKSAMIEKTKEILDKAEYLYSTQDKHGNNDVYRWDYFFVPIEIDGQIAGERIAVKDNKYSEKSQIYNYGIKKEATSTFNGLHRNVNPTISDKPNVASNNIISDVANNSNANSKIQRQTISSIGDRQANDIKNLLGGDYSGYSNAINSNAIKHIEKRHGLNGLAYTSMSKVEDIARVGYVLDNYDTVDILRNSNGDILRSKEFLTANGEHAPMLLYKKQINGTYYTAQAAVDGRYKKNWVISAYFNNKEGITQKLDAVAPSSKSSETLSASLPSNSIVSNTSQNYNTNLENNIAVLPIATDNSIKQKVENNVLPRAVNTETTNDTRSVITKLKDSIPELSDMKPVSTITGTEFQKGSKKITETVGEFFASLGNKVVRKGFGDIVVDMAGVKDSVAYGLGKRKAATFKSVPAVLENGK